MYKKQFKAESKRILDLTINSANRNSDLFLREMIMNSSDALDKLYYRSLESGYTGIDRNGFIIKVALNKEARTVTVSDNGVGMTFEDLEKNLGTIARTSTVAFEDECTEELLEKADSIDVSEKLGVGFYSAFMVSEMVTVLSKAYGSQQANIWESHGPSGFTVLPASKDTCGTIITLHLKEDTEDQNYSQYLDTDVIVGLIKKYSDYIRYPIKLKVDGSLKTINSMSSIWHRPMSKVKHEDYGQYYMTHFSDFTGPLRIMRASVEGLRSYTALLFIPSHAPYNYYTSNYKVGLQLYCSGVLVMDKCADFLPDYFRFIKGLVDTQDLPLNMSKEDLQNSKKLKAIAKSLVKRIKKEMEAFLEEDRQGYEKFFDVFGPELKHGLYDGFGDNKEILQDLVLFYSSKDMKYTTLEEYVSRMKQGQKYIYYACGESLDAIDILPQAEFAKANGNEILYLTDEIDEFALKAMIDYDGIRFKSVEDENMEEDAEAIARAEKYTKDNRELLKYMEGVLGSAICQVKFSPRLKESPVCLTTKGEITLEMEKVLGHLPGRDEVHARKVLEINPTHPIVKKLQSEFSKDDGKEVVSAITEVLYNQALLISGFPIDNPVKQTEDICKLLI